MIIMILTDHQVTLFLHERNSLDLGSYSWVKTLIAPEKTT